MKRDIFTRDWIIEQALDVLSQYEPGVLTIRALHYQLVSRGMTNEEHGHQDIRRSGGFG